LCLGCLLFSAGCDSPSKNPPPEPTAQPEQPAAPQATSVEPSQPPAEPAPTAKAPEPRPAAKPKPPVTESKKPVAQPERPVAKKPQPPEAKKPQTPPEATARTADDAPPTVAARRADARASTAAKANKPVKKPPPEKDDAGCAEGQKGVDPRPAAEGPHPKWVCKEQTVTAGPVWAGKKLEFPFEIKNEGEANLTIRVKGG
jgi:hypothetical protein